MEQRLWDIFNKFGQVLRKKSKETPHAGEKERIELLSNNAGPNNNEDTALSCMCLRTMGVLQSL